MKNSMWVRAPFVAMILLAALPLFGDYIWMAQRQGSTVPSTAMASVAQTASISTNSQVSAASTASLEAAVKHQVDALWTNDQQVAPADIADGLNQPFGNKTVLEFFQVPEFAHHLVATVDNLGRTQASARLWPLNRPVGQFQVAMQGELSVIGLDNGLRYAPYVLLPETVDLRQAAMLHAHFYPQFRKTVARQI